MARGFLQENQGRGRGWRHCDPMTTRGEPREIRVCEECHTILEEHDQGKRIRDEEGEVIGVICQKCVHAPLR